MNVELIVCILLGILLALSTWKAVEYWREKEHYRCEWLHNYSGEYFRRKDVVALTENPNRTMNVVLGNGHTINTGLEIDELKEVLGIGFSCSVDEELAHRRKNI